MGLIDPRLVTRFPVPHEPGEWVELRRLSGGTLRRLARTSYAEADGMAMASLKKSIVAWSYSDTVTDEDIDALDNKTLIWLVGLSGSHSVGDLSDDEKKDATSRLIDSSPASQVSTETSTATA